MDTEKAKQLIAKSEKLTRYAMNLADAIDREIREGDPEIREELMRAREIIVGSAIKTDEFCSRKIGELARAELSKPTLEVVSL